jgi:hypothetical protein
MVASQRSHNLSLSLPGLPSMALSCLLRCSSVSRWTISIRLEAGNKAIIVTRSSANVKWVSLYTNGIFDAQERVSRLGTSYSVITNYEELPRPPTR